jgi:23S rRNA pseudouridine1911/1915/1917 synthase
MSTKYEFIFNSEPKQRLDHFLVEELKTSRSQVIKLISDGHCTVNGLNKKPSQKLNADDLIIITIPESKEFSLAAEDINLNIVYEDEDLIVVNKDFGMVVHPSHGHDTGTLVNALLFHCKELSVGFHEHRPGIVHRLDKDTGGLMVVAKTQLALANLAEQFKSKTAGRIYNAICFGRPKVLSGSIENHLGRDPKDRKKFSSTGNSRSGKFAKTNFKALFEGPVSIFELKLETGRTHQIRVHLSEYGCPIVNDPIYSTPRRLNSIMDPGLKAKIKENSNMFLFARRLSFIHPVTKKNMSFTVPLPNSFNNLLNYLNVQISDY